MQQNELQQVGLGIEGAFLCRLTVQALYRKQALDIQSTDHFGTVPRVGELDLYR